MPKKSSTAKGNISGLGTAIVLIAVLLLGGYYFTSGSDPLGLFGGTKPTVTAPSTVIESTATAKPTQPVTNATSTLVDNTSFPPPTSTWWEVYFVTPLRLKTSDELTFNAKIPAQNYQGSIPEQLIKHIDDAKKTIHIASFETDLNDVANALIRAKQRGVDVRWITDDESGIAADTKPGHGQFKMLKAAGIPLKDDARGALMHDKFWLFDGQITWTGSTNVTVSGMFEQNNNAIVIYSPELTAIYERQWAEMWAGNFNAKSPSTVDQQSLKIDGTPIQILFSPEDKAISHIVPYVQKAKSSIRFLAFTFTQDQLGAAMIERKKGGVEVRGVFESTGSDTEYSEMIPLYCAKAPVRQDGNPAFLHHKVIIIDERIVITGSLNFTDNADESNNENVIIIDNADIAKLYTQEFQRVWDAGHDPDPAKIKCK
jgi:phosphatidylserine/phosphatidylglycerophosphate/cardiolipin synthase-like enzyme